MNIEIRILTWSVILGFVHIIATAHSASLQRGYRWTASARDEPLPPLTGVAGRLERSLRNFLETFPLFAALVLAVQASGRHGQMSEWGTILYFAARLAYIPLYALGVPLVRSLVWNIAAVGIALLVTALL